MEKIQKKARFLSFSMKIINFWICCEKRESPADFYIFDQTHGLAGKLKFSSVLNGKSSFWFSNSWKHLFYSNDIVEMA